MTKPPDDLPTPDPAYKCVSCEDDDDSPFAFGVVYHPATDLRWGFGMSYLMDVPEEPTWTCDNCISRLARAIAETPEQCPAHGLNAPAPGVTLAEYILHKALFLEIEVQMDTDETDNLAADLMNEDIESPWAIIDQYGKRVTRAALEDPLGEWHDEPYDSAYRTDLFIECCQGWKEEYS